MQTSRTLLEDKLFFTHLPFWPEVGHLVDVGSGPLAEVAMAAKRDDLTVKCVDSAFGLDWRQFLETEGALLAPTALLFSSVIHELFSEGGHYRGQSPKSFWADVAAVDPEYVIVRDMAWKSVPKSWHESVLPGGMRRVGDWVEALMTYQLAVGMRGLPIGPTNRRVTLALEKESPELLFRELTEMRLKGEYLDGPTAAVEMEEHYFALEPEPFVEQAALFGYAPVHARHFIPDYIATNQLGKAVASTFIPTFTTHVEYVFKRT